MERADLSKTGDQELDERLDDQMVAVGKLVGSIAHDFNNVLTLIKSYCHLAQMDAEEQEPVEQSLERIVSASDRGVILSKQLMLMAPQASGTTQEIDVNDVILELQSLLSRLFEPRIKMHLNLGAGLPGLRGSPAILGQFVLDMVLNASRWVTPQGDALLETRLDTIDDAPFIVISLRLTRSRPLPDDHIPVFKPILTEYIGLEAGPNVPVDMWSGRVASQAYMRAIHSADEAVMRYELEIPCASDS
ncbi:MAG: hypothetical protein ACNA8W_07175 [Bradymonadaceae bacterium]